MVVGAKGLRALLARSGPDRMVLAPLLEPSEQLRDGQASADVRLGCRFRLVEATAEDVVDTINTERRRPLRGLQFVPLGRAIVLHPHQLLLGETLEFVRLPHDHMCYVMGRSSWARDGLLVATAVGVHPGFSGCVTLELRNLGEVPIRLYPGDLIAQLFVEEVTGNSPDDIGGAGSQFSGGAGPRRGEHRYKPTLERLRRLSKKESVK
jgi:dCTP deaminase